MIYAQNSALKIPVTPVKNVLVAAKQYNIAVQNDNQQSQSCDSKSSVINKNVKHIACSFFWYLWLFQIRFLEKICKQLENVCVNETLGTLTSVHPPMML